MEKFPERVFTLQEVEKARRLIKEGYRHRLRVIGNPNFKDKVKKALKLIDAAKYRDFLRTYIKSIVETNGLSQLREAEAAIWANKYTVADPLEGAGLLIQKAQQMKDYIEGKAYLEVAREMSGVEKRIEFLRVLKNRSGDPAVRRRCEDALKLWEESKFL